MTRSRLTKRVSGCGRVKDKVIGAEVKELSIEDTGRILSMDIEITKMILQWTLKAPRAIPKRVTLNWE